MVATVAAKIPIGLLCAYVQEKEGRVEPTGSTLQPQPPVL